MQLTPSARLPQRVQTPGVHSIRRAPRSVAGPRRSQFSSYENASSTDEWQQPLDVAQQPLRGGHAHPSPRSSSLAAALGISKAAAHSMLAACPALRNYNHSVLAAKVEGLARALQLQPQQLARVLAAQQPHVLLRSPAVLQQRVDSLEWLEPDLQQRAQLALQAPALLSWAPRQLRGRVQRMAGELGTDVGRVAGLLRQHPQLLPASSHLSASLALLQQLLLLAAAAERGGFGTGVAVQLTAAAAAHSRQQQRLQYRQVVMPPTAWPQQQLVSPAESAATPASAAPPPAITPDAVVAAAQQMALTQPQLLLAPPEVLQARVAALQASSGLGAPQVAALLVAQPQLLLVLEDAAAARGVDPGGPGRRRTRRRQ